MIKIFAISGSLRSSSSNTALLNAISILAPMNVKITICNFLKDIPLFSPDLENEPPTIIKKFRTELNEANGIMIASPEYAHGVAGGLKNALDWVVGSGEFVRKPVAILNASSRATHAYEALTETIKVMDAKIIQEASLMIPITPGKFLNETEIATSDFYSSIIKNVITSFIMALDGIISQPK